MKIGVTGCAGRVGALVVAELVSGAWDDRGLELAGGTMRDVPKEPLGYFVTNKAEELFDAADVVIDFTSPAATMAHAALAAQTGTPLIIGTTGLNAENESDLKKAAAKAPIIYAANMSVGVNLLLALVEQAAARLDPEWDIEIFEAHHKHKIDAPSGTALALGKAAQTARKGGEFATNRSGERKQGDIGFAVERGGDVVGEHTVSFLGAGERVELTHRATNRTLFAKGALHAALWVKGKKPGLYSMRDVLDL